MHRRVHRSRGRAVGFGQCRITGTLRVLAGMALVVACDDRPRLRGPLDWDTLTPEVRFLLHALPCIEGCDIDGECAPNPFFVDDSTTSRCAAISDEDCRASGICECCGNCSLDKKALTCAPDSDAECSNADERCTHPEISDGPLDYCWVHARQLQGPREVKNPLQTNTTTCAGKFLALCMSPQPCSPCQLDGRCVYDHGECVVGGEKPPMWAEWQGKEYVCTTGYPTVPPPTWPNIAFLPDGGFVVVTDTGSTAASDEGGDINQPHDAIESDGELAPVSTSDD